jgi:hypothetical protein
VSPPATGASVTVPKVAHCALSIYAYVRSFSSHRAGSGHGTSPHSGSVAPARVDPMLERMGLPAVRRHVVDGFAVDVIENLLEEIDA